MTKADKKVDKPVEIHDRKGKEVSSRSLVYKFKHCRDSVNWELGEKGYLMGAVKHFNKKDRINADFFSLGDRSVYIDGVSISTWGGETLSCPSNCQEEHEYVRTLTFYKKV